MQDILSNKHVMEELLPETQILYYLPGGDGGAPSSEALWGKSAPSARSYGGFARSTYPLVYSE